MRSYRGILKQIRERVNTDPYVLRLLAACPDLISVARLHTGTECDVSRLAQLMMDTVVRSDVECVFTGLQLRSVLHGARALGASPGGSSSFSSR